MSALGAAAEAAMTALVGEAGIAEDSAIMISQLGRATRALRRPAVPSGALFGCEPTDHAAALLRLAPETAR
jgi:hypothetical protein